MALTPAQRGELADLIFDSCAVTGYAYADACEGVRAIESTLAQMFAAAWDEGHRTVQRLGPDDCRCEAWNMSECACGLWGTNVITPNPYRTT